MAHSTRSSLNEVPHLEESEQRYPIGSVTQPPSGNFFDNILSQQSQEFYNFERANFIPTTGNSEGDNPDETEGLTTNAYFQTKEDSVSYEDPEINPNEIYDRLHKNNYHVNEQHDKQLNNYLKIRNENDVDSIKENIKSLSVKDDSKVEGNLETFRKLSTPVIQLVDDSAVPDGILQCNCEMETLALLEKEKNQNSFLQELKVNKERVSFLEKAVAYRDVKLKEKSLECDELNARLRTSRSRITNLERELTLLRESELQNNAPGDVELRRAFSILTVQNYEIIEDISELQEKLNKRSLENIKLKSEVKNLTSELSLSSIKLQVPTGVDTQSNCQIENLSYHLKACKKQIIDLNDLITSLNSEKEQAAIQYQEYIEHLNFQLGRMAQELLEKEDEVETLTRRELDLLKQVGESETLLLKLQNENTAGSSKPSASMELTELQGCINTLQEENNQLEESYEIVEEERDNDRAY